MIRPTRRIAVVGVVAVAVVIATSNAAIALAVLLTRMAVAVERPGSLPGITHLRAVDHRVWRGDVPSPASYEQLAHHGVTTVVDLRAERDLNVPADAIAAAGIERVHLPVRDGQAPAAGQVERFLAVVRAAPGRVYVHCGAGVGRTGSMAGAYLVRAVGWDRASVLARTLEVGAPSLEQLWYVGRLAPAGPAAQPPSWVSAVSRVVDVPRRIWSRVRG